MLGTLRDHFLANVSRWPDRKAIIDQARTYTFGELNRRCESIGEFPARDSE